MSAASPRIARSPHTAGGACGQYTRVNEDLRQNWGEQKLELRRPHRRTCGAPWRFIWPWSHETVGGDNHEPLPPCARACHRHCRWEPRPQGVALCGFVVVGWFPPRGRRTTSSIYLKCPARGTSRSPSWPEAAAPHWCASCSPSDPSACASHRAHRRSSRAQGPPVDDMRGGVEDAGARAPNVHIAAVAEGKAQRGRVVSVRQRVVLVGLPDHLQRRAGVRPI